MSIQYKASVYSKELKDRSMRLGKFLFAVLGALYITSSAHGKNASDFCPSDIDSSCLEAIADQVIKSQVDATERQQLALRYADVLFPKSPNYAASLAAANKDGADWRSLRRLADKFAAAGQTKDAGKLIWAATQARADDPILRVKVLDMLLMAEDAADIGDLELARRVHRAVIPYLTGELSGYVPLSDELRVARLMALYGWPEDAYPFLQKVYPTLKSLPRDSAKYGFTLTHLLTVFILTGNDVLANQSQEDIAALLNIAKPDVQKQVQRSHVTALVEAGKMDSAKATASEYSLDFDQTIKSVPHLFLQKESEYFPGISANTLHRYEEMLAAIKSPELKADFLAKLASQMIEDKQYEKLDKLLDKAEDPKLRSELVLQLMLYHARERKDAKTAADLYFAEIPLLAPKFPQLGTFLQQYPLSLTARGLLEAGDLERGGQLADVVLHLWLSDQSERRNLDGSLIGALAAAGDEDRVSKWYAASKDTTHKFDVLFWSVLAQANAGQFDHKDAMVKQLTALLPFISDAKRNPPAYWPADRLFPTLRDEARYKLFNLNTEIVAALAKFGQLDAAKESFAGLGESETYPWRAELAIADAIGRSLGIDQANDAKRTILDKVLDGDIDANEMPFVIKAMHP